MTSRERVLLALNHKEADRVAIHDSPWGTTVERWHREGLPEGVSPDRYFGYEFVGFGADTSFRFKEEVVEETDEYIIMRNSNGALIKNWKHRTSTPEMMDFTIKSRKDWEEHKWRLRMDRSRIDWRAVEWCKKAREEGYFVHYSGVLGYDKTQGIVGSERLLMAMIDDPDWVREMFEASGDLIIETAEEMMAGGFEFDGAFLFDDMGYRNSSLFSPQMYRELLKPVHKRVFDFFHGKGLKVILHSCGCVKGLVPDLIDAGLDCLQPLEVKAGMDLIELKKRYGDVLAFMGGIDVRKMADPDPLAIEEEIRTKITFAKRGGGYIYHSDHSVPDNVSFERYKRVIELVMHYGRYDVS
jgi:uroporphyrinogen decarboxylase